MGEAEPEVEGPQFQVYVPPELEGGVYANFVGVWHSPYEFTLDFCATQPAQQEGEEAAVVVPCRVVSRIRIPVTLIFDVLRTLNENMGRYESAYGEIQRPSPPEEESQEQD